MNPGVIIDRDLCVGTGQCVLAAPRFFDQDDREGLVLLREDAPEEFDDRVREAVRNCPTSALSLE